MRQRLASTDISVEELLSGRYVFSIPAYQRDYAWTKVEALQLIDDIASAIADVEREETAVPYFLGTMLLVTPPRHDGGLTLKHSPSLPMSSMASRGS